MPRTYTLRRGIAAAAAVAACIASVVGPAPVAAAAPKWASASRARIHPGVQTISSAGQCTTNFVFYDSKYVYIGQAAHCTAKNDLTDVNASGCNTPVQSVGKLVKIEGATKPARVVYNSWNTMQAVKERSSNACFGNDFALVRLNGSDVPRVNPSVPFWGGPSGLGRSVGMGQSVYSYGDSSLRFEIDALSPKAGVAMFDDLGGWQHAIYTVTPGIFGDSGSAVIGPKGHAIGVLVTIALVPPAMNYATDLYRALSYMKKYTALDGVKLATGTTKFDGL